jgi:transposase
MRLMKKDSVALPSNLNEAHALIIEQSREITALSEKISLLLHDRFGRKTERFVDDKSQGRLFDDAAKAVIPPVENEVAVKAHIRHKRQLLLIKEGTPVEEKIIDIPEQDKICGCGKHLVRIGEESRYKVRIIPEKTEIIKEIYPKYACHFCEGSGDEDHPAVRMAERPAQIIPKSPVTASLLAYILVLKFNYSMPFHRLSKRFGTIGIEISRANMSNWAVKAGLAVGKMMKLLWKELLLSPSILADETPFRVFRVPNQSNTKNSFMWAFRGGGVDKPIHIYEYHPTRSGKVPAELLKDYSGFVQTDGYGGYNLLDEFPKITHVGDWAHVRRKFHEAAKAGSGDNHSAHGLSLVQKLFQIEKELRDKYPVLKRFSIERKKQVKPLFSEIKAWLEDLICKVAPELELGKAVNYTLKEWSKLVRYIESPYLTPSTNEIENAIRLLVVGRKNFMFCGSPEGAQAAANIYSLIKTAEAYGLDPWQYLAYLFNRLPLVKSEDELKGLLPVYIDKTLLAADQ